MIKGETAWRGGAGGESQVTKTQFGSLPPNSLNPMFPTLKK